MRYRVILFCPSVLTFFTSFVDTELSYSSSSNTSERTDSQQRAITSTITTTNSSSTSVDSTSNMVCSLPQPLLPTSFSHVLIFQFCMCLRRANQRQPWWHPADCSHPSPFPPCHRWAWMRRPRCCCRVGLLWPLPATCATAMLN